jgi:hypothetical protein
MKMFDCDYDTESNNTNVNQIRTNIQDRYVSVALESDGDVGVLWMQPSKARELAAELIRLADEIEKQ